MFENYSDQIDELKSRIIQTVDKHREAIDQFNQDLEPLIAQAENLRQEINADIDSIEIEMPEVPEAEVFPDENKEDEEWIFDSSRDFFTQIGVYRRFFPKDE